MSSSSSDPRVLAESSGTRTHEKRDCTVRGESETVEVVVVVVVVRAHLWARGKKRRLSAFVSSLPRAERSTAEPTRSSSQRQAGSANPRQMSRATSSKSVMSAWASWRISRRLSSSSRSLQLAGTTSLTPTFAPSSSMLPLMLSVPAWRTLSTPAPSSRSLLLSRRLLPRIPLSMRRLLPSTPRHTSEVSRPRAS